jgi:osmotically-inducible protein OsmY
MRISTVLLVPLLLSCTLGSAAMAAGQAQDNASGARPDNTRVNARDKDGAASTPQKQSNAKADRELLAAVRKSVVNDKSLSVSAHNVKMMAADGAVTLRGPVASDDEKGKVEALVKQVSGVTSVDNQLDVKSK